MRNTEKTPKPRARMAAALLSLFLTAGLLSQLSLTGLGLTEEEKTPHCGLEAHTHSAECAETQETICQLPEGHEHTAECQSEPALTCALEVHTHGDTCRKLVCETPEHTHSDACQQALTCENPDPEHIHEGGCYTDVECAIPEHTHNDECYELTCAKTPHAHGEGCYTEAKVCAIEVGHVHSEGCYQTVYNCGKPEHTHALACYSDPSADLETAAVWESTLPQALTGQWADDLLAVAASQLGYSESTKNYAVENETERKGYSRYGAWKGTPYADWNALFAAFCLHYAGIPDAALPFDASCPAWAAALKEAQLYTETEGYTPKAGDLVFLDPAGNASADRVGIVTELQDNTLRTCEGDVSGSVQAQAYQLDLAEDSSKLLGYLDLSAAYTRAESLGLLAKDEELAPTGDTVFTYEDENYQLDLRLTAKAPLPESDQQSLDINTLAMTVSPVEETSSAYQQLAQFAQDEDGDNKLIGLQAMTFQFFDGEQLVDVSGYGLTIEITPKQALIAAGLAAMPEDAAAEAEVGLVFSAMESSGGAVTPLEDELLVTPQPKARAKRAAAAPASFTVTMNAGSTLALKATQTANPKFTVQYYAYVDTVSTSGSDPLTLIDTNNGGTNSGGKLPQNGVTPATKNLYLTQSGGTYQVATNKDTATQVYSDKEFEYIQAPNLIYFNRLYENGNYALDEIWILKDGKNAASTDKADWTVYGNPGELHFTNREESVNANTLLIKEGAVIRLVYSTTADNYNNAAAFYDYDITSGKTSTFKNSTLLETARYGINSSGNYSNSGSKLAFGNQNTGVDHRDISWNRNTLNKFNTNGHKGCTFGLASRLDDNGHIVYSSGVDAPNLFNDGYAAGKTQIDQGWSLNFKRDGDTYTLFQVNGTSTTNLDSFHQWETDNWSNDFWPMDGLTGTVDPQFGSTADYNGGLNGTYAYTVNQYGTPYSMPKSDDGHRHNHYFGMQYAVNFTLTEDYVGPLEYYFFGDDDMWVFLDGRLVCDIGGVHSSVGEYVNLWDYIGMGTDAGTHTLSFFYTERGASGSSCYMRFTLPSVSSVTPEQNTGTLRVEKEVVGPTKERDEEFSFQIHFTDANGSHLKDDYSYTRYQADGTVVKTDVIIYDGGSFQLKDGEYIIVKYLPVDANYYIEELNTSGYGVTVTINGGSPNATATATGAIHKQTQDSVHYINESRFELPETGGAGVTLFTAFGLLVMSMAGWLMISLRRKQSRPLHDR